MRFYSETKISDFRYDLEKRLRFFPYDPFTLPLSSIKWTKNYIYVLERGDSRNLMIISDYINTDIKKNYRLALTAMGSNRNILREIIDEFTQKTKVSLRPAPEHMNCSLDLECIAKRLLAKRN